MDGPEPPADGGGTTPGGSGGAVARDAGPGPALARDLPAPAPPRRIERPAGAGVASAEPKRGPGRPRKAETEKRALRREREGLRERAPKRAASAGGAAASAASAAAPNDGRDLAASVYAHHERAARWLGQPVLALTRAEAADVADALRQAGELTGWQPSGPLWGWLSVLTTLGGVYVGKLLALRALAAAAAAEQAAHPARPEPAPFARIMPAPAPPVAAASPASSASSRTAADDPRLGPMPGLTDYADRFEP